MQGPQIQREVLYSKPRFGGFLLNSWVSPTTMGFPKKTKFVSPTCYVATSPFSLPFTPTFHPPKNHPFEWTQDMIVASPWPADQRLKSPIHKAWLWAGHFGIHARNPGEKKGCCRKRGWRILPSYQANWFINHLQEFAWLCLIFRRMLQFMGETCWWDRLADRMKCLMRWLRIWKASCNLKWIKLFKKGKLYFPLQVQPLQKNSLNIYFGMQRLGLLLFPSLVWGVLWQIWLQLGIHKITFWLPRSVLNPPQQACCLWVKSDFYIRYTQKRWVSK